MQREMMLVPEIFLFLAKNMDRAKTLQGGPTCLGDAFE